VPPNLEFVIDDAEDNWTGQNFDYIHVRMLAGAIKDWHRLLQQILEHLNPGGWLEVGEFEILVHSDNDTPEQCPNIKLWCKLLQEAARKIERPFEVAIHLKEWLENAGYTEVTKEVKKVSAVFCWERELIDRVGRRSRLRRGRKISGLRKSAFISSRICLIRLLRTAKRTLRVF
jgi:hypothetical protein